MVRLEVITTINRAKKLEVSQLKPKNQKFSKKKHQAFVPIEKLREKCFKNLKIPEKRVKFTEKQVEKVERKMVESVPQMSKDYSAICEQIRRDMKVYKVYDAFAMWLDADGGLAKYEPDLIRKIVVMLGL